MTGVTCYRTGRGQYHVRAHDVHSDIEWTVESGTVYGGIAVARGSAPVNTATGRLDIIAFASLPQTAQRELQKILGRDR